MSTFKVASNKYLKREPTDIFFLDKIFLLCQVATIKHLILSALIMEATGVCFLNVWYLQKFLQV